MKAVLTADVIFSPTCTREQEDAFLRWCDGRAKGGLDEEIKARWLAAYAPMQHQAFEAALAECKAPSQAATHANDTAPPRAREPNPADRYILACGRKLLAARLAKCESPAEEAMLAGFVLVNLEPAQQVEIAPFRVDFAFADARLVVEVDGFAFHDRTHEQAQRDRARDRALVSDGWRVVRFTAVEVFADARRCAGEVAAMLGGKAA